MKAKRVAGQFVGLDIGGANLKVAFSSHEVVSIPFALWKQPEKLEPTLQTLLANCPTTSVLAVTMTGELADCFASRQEGVTQIVQAIERAAGTRTSRFYHTNLPLSGLRETCGNPSSNALATDSNWFNTADAIINWLSVAAANWHAIANFASRYLPAGNGFLIDIGSTTTDIIPVRGYLPAALGLTDFERLRSRELFYGGVQRTPISSLCASFQVNGQSVLAAREFFATIEDAFIVAGAVPEKPMMNDTADGRPASLAHSQQRLARMVCNDFVESIQGNVGHSDSSTFLDAEVIKQMANQAICSLQRGVRDSVRAVLMANQDLPLRFVVAGQGAWFAAQVIGELLGTEADIIQLADQLGAHVSHSAAAYAVAILAEEDAENRSKVRAQQPPRRATRIKPIGLRVIKLGGSLLDWTETPAKIREWLSRQPPMYNVWLVGGGNLVETVRDWSHLFPLDEAIAHQWCLDLMNINRRLVGSWFPEWRTIDQLDVSCLGMSVSNVLLDFSGWLNQFECPEDRLPESWCVSSDSCAAYFANAAAATELVLLKSCDVPVDQELRSLARAGIVDELFPKFAQSIPALRLINLRADDSVKSQMAVQS